MRRCILLSLILICMCLCTACAHNHNELILSEEYVTLDSEVSDLQITTTAELSDNKVAVYVCGAVVSPGVYYLPIDAIKQDALEAADGFCEGAATTYVNLAEKIKEGEQIYFPYEEELVDGYSLLDDEGSGKVNINRATKDELMTLPGIGESKAEAIISYREEHGAFQSIEEITSIPGIKEGIYDNIKDYIVVD
ncbi:MAG: helix-hairpin-helix domain-containing protein [Lachnospiraceae bacterium]|nr:helix-hairpin-helix domain-containing protein [Lachnospiraceae bacterium]